MTREEAKKLLPIIKAFSEGKEIEGIYKGIKSPWFKVEDMVFDGGTKYRIKPEPAYRPFKDAEECWAEMQKHQPFGWVKSKQTQNKFACKIVGKEFVFAQKPYREDIGDGKPYWEMDAVDYWCELPKGRIKQLIGRSLTWKDEPVEKKIKGLEIWV